MAADSSCHSIFSTTKDHMNLIKYNLQIGVKPMKKYVLTLLVLGIWALQVSAQTIWHIAPGRSSFNFEVKHLLFFKVEGKFKKFEGKVVTQDGDFANASFDGKIQVSSIYTGNQDRDNHLLSEDFFCADKFPEIIFKCKSSVKTGENTYKIIGDLTMRGITKPINLTAKYEGQKKLSNGKTRVDLTFTGSLNRFDYELKWNEIIESGKAIVGKMVEIRLNVVLFKGNE